MRSLVALALPRLVSTATAETRSARAPLLPLAVRGLGYDAGGRTILDGVDLDLGPSGLTVLLGPNGAGKSVLLRLLNGLLEPARGAVLWGGRAPDAEVRRRQAFVFQKPVLLRRSALANVVFVLKLRGVADPTGRAKTALAAAGLGSLARQPARLLSGGEQQRLAFLRALVTRPEVLLLDEPTASLDPTSTAAIEAMLQDAVGAGTRAVLVTHDVAQARRVADDIVFLAGGRITEHTPAGAFFHRPASEAARAYLDGRLLL